MEIVNLEEKRLEKKVHLKILLEYGHVIVITNLISILLELRDEIEWEIEKGSVFYHIELNNFDNYLKVDKIISMEILDER